MLVVAGGVLDLLHEFVLESLAARGHHRHSGVNDVVHLARREISDRGHDRIEHVLLEVFAAPMLDVGMGRSGARQLANSHWHFRQGPCPAIGSG